MRKPRPACLSCYDDNLNAKALLSLVRCVLCPHSTGTGQNVSYVPTLCCRPANDTCRQTRSLSSSFLIKPPLQSNILMADPIPSTKVCRNCKQKNPSISCGRLTVNCLDCRNRQASGASKRTAEQAELSPIRREVLPLIDLQLRIPINPQESILLGTPIATSTRAGAPITSPPGPSIASQEGSFYLAKTSPGKIFPPTCAAAAVGYRTPGHGTSKFRASGS
ncbi:hypothetical protein EDB81DRAFT_830221 [Dactylonectria macrodidyma]|uniref:Uncharacterized protein n=1 Tax=Dactylonectria macrodidyma TaxID=307937 RepID=A0A9P9D2C7_9HYPO|nr:hypothetical protein EDB81DRAFT_830221 [Dactylonectria macrodidyma]